MRLRVGLLALWSGCGAENGGSMRDTAHPGQPPAEDHSESSASEMALLQYLIEHEWTIGDLVQRAKQQELTDSTRAALEDHEKQRLDNEADLIAARQGYGGGRSPVPLPREPADRLDEFKGKEYERVLRTRLLGHYAEEVAVIDTALPRIHAEHVRRLVDRIRAQRLEDIQELAGNTQR